jgi:phosphomevalonate kinase
VFYNLEESITTTTNDRRFEDNNDEKSPGLVILSKNNKQVNRRNYHTQNNNIANKKYSETRLINFPTNSRMMLQLPSSSSSSDYEGAVSLMISYAEKNNPILYSEIVKSLLDYSYSSTLDPEAKNIQDFINTIQV